MVPSMTRPMTVREAFSPSAIYRECRRDVQAPGSLWDGVAPASLDRSLLGIR